MINGKKYVSAHLAAGMTKYTQDYVGQLCREGKVQATRFGRNWYVDIESLLAYKEQNESDVLLVRFSNEEVKGVADKATNEVFNDADSRDIQDKNEERVEKIEVPTTSVQDTIKGEITKYFSDESPLLPPLRRLSDPESDLKSFKKKRTIHTGLGKKG